MHDSQYIDDLIVAETHIVYTDSVYMDAKRKEDLESRGVFCGIVECHVRGHKEPTAAHKWHNRLVVGFRTVV